MNIQLKWKKTSLQIAHISQTTLLFNTYFLTNLSLRLATTSARSLTPNIVDCKQSLRLFINDLFWSHVTVAVFNYTASTLLTSIHLTFTVARHLRQFQRLTLSSVYMTDCNNSLWNWYSIEMKRMHVFAWFQSLQFKLDDCRHWEFMIATEQWTINQLINRAGSLHLDDDDDNDVADKVMLSSLRKLHLESILSQL